MTVNSNIFARDLFLRNFTDGIFCENNPSWNGEITLSFTDIGKSIPSRDFPCVFKRHLQNIRINSNEIELYYDYACIYRGQDSAVWS